MSNDFELSGPAFVAFIVRDLAVAADFYEKTLGFRRDPENFPNAVAFLSYPVPFALRQSASGLPVPPQPISVPAIWFKTANSQIVHDKLVEAGVTILRSLTEGRFGKQFTFIDPDGYAITIYDRDAPSSGRQQAV